MTDGSYDKKKEHDIDICETGWIILWKSTGQCMSGSLVECSNSTSSYRGELLGMLAIHLFLPTTEEYYNMMGISNDILYDNMGAF